MGPFELLEFNKVQVLRHIQGFIYHLISGITVCALNEDQLSRIATLGLIDW